ncbi:MAG TPA: hypothetical protein VFV40_07265 [Nocardioides sp.]|nr:hypothetical protein [Nocardioides sp.]
MGVATDGDGVGAAEGWSPLLRVVDPAGDQNGAPGHADVMDLTLEEGGGQLRVSVRLGSTVPGRLADREVQGVGVDLFRGRSQESDYQLFLDGGAQGWRGFLQTRRGFVPYPGTVAVRGDVLTTTVPWTSLGGRVDAEVSAFVDWSDGTGRTGWDRVQRTTLRLP